VWQRDIDMVNFQPQCAAARQSHPFHQISPKAHLFQIADHLPGVSALVPLCLLQLVQRLQHRQRQHDVVVLKGLQGIRSLNQNVGVQYISLLHCHARLPAGTSFREFRSTLQKQGARLCVKAQADSDSDERQSRRLQTF